MMGDTAGKVGDAVRIYGHGSLTTRNTMMQGVRRLRLVPLNLNLYQIFVGCVCFFVALLTAQFAIGKTTFKAYGFLLCFAYITPLCITFVTGGMETTTWGIWANSTQDGFLVHAGWIECETKFGEFFSKKGIPVPACIWSSRGHPVPLSIWYFTKMKNIRNMLKQVNAWLHATGSTVKWGCWC